MSETSAELLPAGTQIDQFALVRLLGRGGMGEVYLARDTDLGRRVALKLISAECLADKQLRERFLYEARTTARFSHPHIVNIHAIGEHDGRPYMALEFLEGESLRDRLQRGPLPLDEVLAVGEAIASALDEAHRHGVLHRDLKPGNVMLADDGRPRVLDFGLAMGLPEGSSDGASSASVSLTKPPPFEHTSTGLRGTPHYMAPEQWAEAKASPATDVWSLGVVLVQMLSARLPYGDVGSLISLAARVSSASPVPGLDELREQTPAPLYELLEQCLSKQADARPTAAEITRRLQSIADGSAKEQEQAPAAARSDSDSREPIVDAALAHTLVPQPSDAYISRPSFAAQRRRRGMLFVLAIISVIGGGLAAAFFAAHQRGASARGDETRRSFRRALAVYRKNVPRKGSKEVSQTRATKEVSQTKATKEVSQTKATKEVSQTKATKEVSQTTADGPANRNEHVGVHLFDYAALRDAFLAGDCRAVWREFGAIESVAKKRHHTTEGLLRVGQCGCREARLDKKQLERARAAFKRLSRFAQVRRFKRYASELRLDCRQRGYWLTKEPVFKDIDFFYDHKKCASVLRALGPLLKRRDLSDSDRDRARAYAAECRCRAKAKKAAAAILRRTSDRRSRRRIIDRCGKVGVVLQPRAVDKKPTP